MKGIRVLQAITITILSFLTNPTFSQVGPPPIPVIPTGTYTCTGTDASNKSDYIGELIISQTGDTYSFKWYETKGDKFNGTGILNTGIANKDSKGILAAEFWSPGNEKKSGLIIYQIQSDGGLVGSWTWADKKEVGSEICKKQR